MIRNRALVNFLFIFCGVVLVASTLWHPVAWAQTPSEDLIQVTKTENLIEKLFKDPTNVELNFKLLEEQTRTGDLLGSAATLDRILLIDPDSKLARVLLAEVQFNLGNLDSAGLVITDLISEDDVPPDMLRRAEAVLDKISDAQSPFNFSFIFNINRGVAKNPRGTSTHDTILLTDVEVNNNGVDGNEGYSEYTLAAKGSYKLASQTPQTLSTTLVAYSRNYLQYDVGDLDSYQLGFDYQRRSQLLLGLGAKLSSVDVNSDQYSLQNTGYFNVSGFILPTINLGGGS